MGSGEVAIVALSTMISLKVTFSDGLGGKAIITKLKAKKEVKYSRHYRCHYAEIEGNHPI